MNCKKNDVSLSSLLWQFVLDFPAGQKLLYKKHVQTFTLYGLQIRLNIICQIVRNRCRTLKYFSQSLRVYYPFRKVLCQYELKFSTSVQNTLSFLPSYSWLAPFSANLQLGCDQKGNEVCHKCPYSCTRYGKYIIYTFLINKP